MPSHRVRNGRQVGWRLPYIQEEQIVQRDRLTLSFRMAMPSKVVWDKSSRLVRGILKYGTAPIVKGLLPPSVLSGSTNLVMGLGYSCQ